MMKVPIDPVRKALANMYMEQHMGKPGDEMIKKLVNKNDEEKSLDYYIACENILNLTIQVLKSSGQVQLESVTSKFLTMLTYVSYEIERLSAFKEND
jgi:hypothetical protein